MVTKTTSADEAGAVLEYVNRMDNEMRILFMLNAAKATSKLEYFTKVKAYGELMAEQRKFLSI